MKQIKHFIFIGLFTCIYACNQGAKPETTQLPPGKILKGAVPERIVDRMVFGRYCGECASHCAPMYEYSMNGNKITFFADHTDSYFKDREHMQFATELDDSFYFNAGNKIINAIPEDMFNSDKKSERFGCPDCADGCGIYLEITIDGKKKSFYIDYQTAELKGETRIFAEFLKAKIEEIGLRAGKSDQ